MKIKDLSAQIAEHSRRCPGKTAIRYKDQTISYCQLEKESNKIAIFLSQQAKKVQYIIILLDRSPGLTASILGVLKGGLIFVPIDPVLPGAMIKKILQETRAEWVITSKQYDEVFKEVISQEGANVLLIEDIHDQDGQLDFEPVYNKYCYIYFTSGSTGIPRGVLGRHRSLAHFIQWEINQFGINEHFNVSQFTSPSFDPFLRDIFVPLAVGATSCIVDKDTLMNPSDLIKWIDQKDIHLIHIVPSLFKMLTKEITDANCFKNLKYVLMAGELLRGNDIRKFTEIFGDRIQLVNVYGPTETTLAKLFYQIKKTDANKTIIPVGEPIEGAQAMILDNDMRKCLTGNIGEIYIRTPFISSGYFNDKELTRQVFLKNPYTDNPQDIIYKTGDLGRQLPDGNIELVGRIDHQVKIRGIRIELGEIENQLLNHQAVRDTVVVARDDGNGDKYLCAYIVSPANVEVSILRTYLSRHLPTYMIPSYFVPMDKIPLNPNGKVDRHALPEPGSKAARNYTAPRNEIEKKLVKIWAEALYTYPTQYPPIGIDDHFFEIGGQSLKAAAVVARIHKELGVKLPLAAIFETPTIKGISGSINDLTQKENAAPDPGEKYTAIDPTEKKEYYPPSSAQKRLFIINQMNKKSLAYNITSIMILGGEVDKDRFETTCKELIQRHESLRTFFPVINGEPAQKIHDNVEFKIEYFLEPEAGGGSEESPAGSGQLETNIIKNFVRPFDLSHIPLLRVGLIKNHQQEYTLMIDIHHIISDIISEMIMIKEFVTLYKRKIIPPMRIQYRDYCQWQQQLIRSQQLKKQENYWLNQFKGEIPTLNLIPDYEEPGIENHEGDIVYFQVGKELTTALKEIIKETNATLFILLLAGFYILLAKYTAQEDIIVGTTTAGRNHADLEQVIGMFVNTLAIRNRPAGTKTLKKFLEEVRENTIHAFQNQDYQFDELIKKLELPRNWDRNPLFEPHFNFQNQPEQAIETSGWKIKPYGYKKQMIQFDLSINGFEAGETISLMLLYRIHLFKRETVEKMAKDYIDILEQVKENITIKIKDIIISHSLIASKSSMNKEDFLNFGL
jgi:amino acid adenylation domain-containing protein